LRIIGGKYRGKHLDLPSGLSARPTTDFAREGLFDILSTRISFEDTDVLDLFSGTGSISFEFISRGAKTVHLVEYNQRNIFFIRRTIKDMNISNIKAVRLDVREFLKVCRYTYDIIFADPPFDLPWLKKLPGMVLDTDLLNEGGFLIVEHPGEISFNDHPGFFEHRKYGRVNFSFFSQPRDFRQQ